MTTQENAPGLTLDRARRYGLLGLRAIGRVMDIALLVLGSLLIGLALSVLLAVFDIVNVVLEISTPAGLASALVLGVVGGFCFGLAGEGPLGRGRRLDEFSIFEVGIGRTLAAFVVGLVGLWAHGILAGLAGDMPEPILQGLIGLRAVSVSGLVAMPLIGVPLSLVARYFSREYPKLRNVEAPIMFVTWALATVIVFS